MLQQVDVGRRQLDRYRGIVSDELIEHVRDLARPLRGARVLHVNATPYGGGVSELLRAVVPLLRDVGIDARWGIISGDADFFRITKAMHNALQGQPSTLSRADRASYLRTAQLNADKLSSGYDVVVVHDPQPAALASLAGGRSAHWVWRCHIDTSAPAEEQWRFVASFLDAYDGVVFTMRQFVPHDLHTRELFVIPPAIDPLSPKNLDLGEQLAEDVLSWIGLDPDDDLVVQVSRFDPWKDPMGVLAAFQQARTEVPGLQLVFAGSMALDDPQGWEVYGRLHDATLDDPCVHLFTNLSGVGNVEVNALQRRARLVVQKSVREGFGLVVSEALWKGTPVVAGRAGGIPLQMADGAGGVLVDDVDACAAAMVDLLTDPERAAQLGERGRARVRDHFLITRLLLNEIAMLERVVNSGAVAPARDPCCGMVLGPGSARLSVTIDGVVHEFCSQHCREAFLASGSAPQA